MDYNFDDNTRQQITAAFADWTNANRNNGSGITYVMGAVGAPANSNQINIVWGTLTENNGQVNNLARAHNRQRLPLRRDAARRHDNP